MLSNVFKGIVRTIGSAIEAVSFLITAIIISPLAVFWFAAAMISGAASGNNCGACLAINFLLFTVAFKFVQTYVTPVIIFIGLIVLLV